MSLKGRQGIPIHPLASAAIITVPDYAEAAIAPVEGTTEGVLVADANVQGWNFVLREPLRLTIKKGKINEVSGPEDYVGKLKALLAMDENASNCAAELGIATSHTMTTGLTGVSWEYGMAGTIHIAFGRNNDIGGKTLSKLHRDLMITKSTVWLDDVCVLENGELRV